jgi:hypothetical protein
MTVCTYAKAVKFKVSSIVASWGREEITVKIPTPNVGYMILYTGGVEKLTICYVTLRPRLHIFFLCVLLCSFFLLRREQCAVL